MRPTASSPLVVLTTFLTLSLALTLHPRRPESETTPAPLEEREANVLSTSLSEAPLSVLVPLEKRRGGGGSSGGGGGGGGGGGRGGGSSSSSSSGSSRSSSSSGSSGSSSGSTGGAAGGTSRNTGTASSSSAARPGYGGGGFYGGGSTSAYRAGSRTPRGLLPFALIGIGAAALILPGLWLYGAYGYNFNNPYNFRNRSANRNETLPVVCLCQQYSACGCDQNDNSTYLDDIVGDGNYNNLNKSLVNVANVNGTKKLVINGTLPNGTDTTSSSSSSSSSASMASRSVVLENAGFWVVGAIVGAMMWSL